MLQRRPRDHLQSIESCKRLLNPIVKAYALSYLSTTVPRLPAAVRRLLDAKLTLEQKYHVLKAVLLGSMGWNRFSTSCALIVAGSTTLPRVLLVILSRVLQSSSSRSFIRILDFLNARLRLLCAFATAWLAFDLLNTDDSWRRKRATSLATQRQVQLSDLPNQHHLPSTGDSMQYAGKTIDFTLLAVCRAVDVVVVTTWIRHRYNKYHPEQTIPRLAGLAKTMADPGLFATSAAIIMWAWFYSPERLPKQYNQWISRVANIDTRLINALRLCRRGELIYGSQLTKDADLPSLCRELDLPEVWGDPSKIIPIPCELYHCGAGKSCEVHAAKRFYKTFQLAMRLYLPLQLVSLFRRFSLNGRRIVGLLKDAATSSSFLAGFVGLFYYAVCLARTRIGPKLINSATVTPQTWDSGLCVLAGCLACGWSIMMEKRGRRQEIAFFVAPRALATLMPRVYDRKHQWREKVAFASSVAIVMNAMSNKDHHVRGVFGSILDNVLR